METQTQKIKKSNMILFTVETVIVAIYGPEETANSSESCTFGPNKNQHSNLYRHFINSILKHQREWFCESILVIR